MTHIPLNKHIKSVLDINYQRIPYETERLELMRIVQIPFEFFFLPPRAHAIGKGMELFASTDGFPVKIIT